LIPMPVAAFHKTRLAPTPSGYLHLGNVFSFALTAALAESHHADILLRIDDMDRERMLPAYLQDIFDTLQFLDIPYDQGPQHASDFEHSYSQRHRLKHYEAALQTLREKGLVYACSCSRTQILQSAVPGTYPGTCRHKHIPLDTPGVAWRLYTDASQKIRVKKQDGSQEEVALPADVQNIVVRKKDGFPAYQLCSVVDDVLFGIDMIVRGQDLWHSSIVQLYLAQALEKASFLEARFLHHPLLLDPSSRKLSKSAGDTSVHYMRQQGLTAQAIYQRLGEAIATPHTVKRWQDLAYFVV